MLTLQYVKQVCLVHRKVDFRKGHDGLLGESYSLGLQPYEGDLVIFVGRNRNSLKLLLYDGTGLWVLYKKFKVGSVRRQFKFLTDPLVSTVTYSEVALLVEGAQYRILK